MFALVNSVRVKLYRLLLLLGYSVTLVCFEYLNCPASVNAVGTCGCGVGLGVCGLGLRPTHCGLVNITYVASCKGMKTCSE